jgi:hypothetical protein
MTERNDTGNDFARGAAEQPQIGPSVSYGSDSTHTVA